MTPRVPGEPMWLGVDAIWAFASMPDMRVLEASGNLSSDPPRLSLFLSHPWETLDVPDPSGRQWRAIRNVLYELLHPTVAPVHDGGLGDMLVPIRFEHYITALDVKLRAHRPRSAAVQEVYRRARRAGTSHASRAISALSATGRADPVLVKRARREVGIWIDYCCLPQGVRTDEELRYFESMLPRLTDLAATSIVVAVWPEETEQMERAWCVAEASIHACATGAQPPALVDGMYGHERPEFQLRRTDLGLHDLRAESGAAIAGLIDAAREDGAPATVRKYFDDRGLRCRVKADLDLLAAAVTGAVAPPSRLGAWAGFLAAGERLCEWLWWFLASPVALLYPLAAADAGLVDRIDAKPRTPWPFVNGAIIFPLLLIFGLLMMSGGTLILLLSPLELLRQRAALAVVRRRAAYVARLAAAARATYVP